MPADAEHRTSWHPLAGDQLVLYALALLLLAAVGVRYATRGAASRAVHKLEPGQRVDYQVNVNTAEAAELALLPGIGPKLAGRIIAHRTQHGPFRRLDALADVPGISRDGVEKLRPLVTLDTPVPPGEPAR